MRKALLQIGLAQLLTATAGADSPSASIQTVIGEVVDTTCFILHQGKGPQHQACANACTQAGSPAAILDEKTHKLVYALNPISPENHHTKRPDDQLLPFVGERVKVHGHLFKRAGVTAVVVESIARAP